MVWESWSDYEFWAQDFSSIIVCSEQDAKSVSRQNGFWKQVLDSEDAYKYELPLPLELGKIFAGDAVMNIPTFQPGDRVRLVSVLSTYLPELSKVNFGKDGSEGIIVDFIELRKQLEQQLKGKLSADEFTSYLRDQVMTEEMELLKKALDGKGCYAVRIDKRQYSESRKGMIYVVAARDLEKL